MSGHGDGDECSDDDIFRDAKAYACSEWASYNCFILWDGYTSADLVQLRSACRMSCGLCPCEDDVDFIDQQGYDCAGWAGFSCYRGGGDGSYDSSYTSYSEAHLADVRQSCPASCGLCP